MFLSPYGEHQQMVTLFGKLKKKIQKLSLEGHRMQMHLAIM